MACLDCGKECENKKRYRCNLCNAIHKKKMNSTHQLNFRKSKPEGFETERLRKYRKAHPHLVFITTSRYLAKKDGVRSELTKDDAKELFDSPNICAYCGNDFDPDKKRSYHFDHIIPMKQGGINARWNITKVCISCNTSKKNSSLIDFKNRTPILTNDRYNNVVTDMIQFSGFTRQRIEQLLELSHSFEREYQSKRKTMMEALQSE